MRRASGFGAALLAIALLAVPAAAQPSDAERLRARAATLAERASAAGATDLLEQARRALLEADRRRGAGDTPGAERAIAIADAALTAAERRVEMHRARRERDAAQARLAELEARVRAAGDATARARDEAARAPATPPAADVSADEESAP